ncbi:Transcription factor IIS [Artemisia annua]|uniref:Transcription factor IIS n=1 Tax=Artemisia annua TaxID=35608 RepID=A0A2U1MWV3_ARTAN|nr:Transcription factor IIS [Artemisia annua]
MGYENDPYRDEDGEPLMDYDDGFQSDHGDDNNHQQHQQPHHLIDENLDDELDDNDWNNDRQNRSPTPVYNESDSKSKPRKRLIKKSTVEESAPDFVDEVEDDVDGFVREDSDGSGGGGKRKKVEGSGKKKKFSSGKFTDRERERERGGRSEKSGSKSKGSGKRRSGEDAEVKEMWETVAGDSEDDKDGPRLADDDNFIDDTGVDPADRYASDHGGYSPSRAPQAEEGEEDDEIRDMFKVGKKKKKTEKSAAEIALLVENVMAELEVVAEEDAELNRQSKPAINKLRKLPLLTEVLSKKQLQLEFLDHGVLTLLRNWLEPLPDGSLPNINIRAAILRILTEFPIDLDQYDRREQLKKSGLGKVIMFLSKSDEETTSNRKLAKDLVDKWSRPIFNKSTRFEDMRNFEDERMPIRRPSMKKPMNKSSGMQSRDDDLDLAEYSQEPKSSSSSSSRLTSRPEAMSLDFVVRPQSKIDPDEIRARAKQVVQDQRRLKMNKRLQQLKAPKKKQLQATKLSVEGRGMVKYL